MIKAARHDGREVLVHNNVILWADVACLGVEDSSHSGRVAWGEAKVDALTAARLKLRQLVGVLELGRQHCWNERSRSWCFKFSYIIKVRAVVSCYLCSFSVFLLPHVWGK